MHYTSTYYSVILFIFDSRIIQISVCYYYVWDFFLFILWICCAIFPLEDDNESN